MSKKSEAVAAELLHAIEVYEQVIGAGWSNQSVSFHKSVVNSVKWTSYRNGYAPKPDGMPDDAINDPRRALRLVYHELAVMHVFDKRRDRPRSGLQSRKAAAAALGIDYKKFISVYGVR